MNDQEWYELCKTNWHAAAAELVAAGYTRVDVISLNMIFFVKGDERVYLARELGSSEWHPSDRYIAQLSEAQR